ncbi:PH domain-containing protein [Litorihabitans aurantiacus]|uniref:Low molecular weight protein antigen 6 PH domain-containing protein n=1 Tax=Litorihabitans aurantiacus TaxID=1930061 RepID=A0AA37UPI1_9MICO|nr:PH domain-containing protein [Litorihabitans aurantiacus]GMA31279.1 hypothetical protein GCM10025875_12710 [Litorihabitans aurantiacus]
MTEQHPRPDRPHRHRPLAGHDRWAPFAPRGAKVVAAVLAVVVLVAVVALFAFVRPNSATRLGPLDYLLMIAFCGVLWGILWRQATVSAVPDPRGLVVRNLLTTRRLEWAEIISVRYSADRAWAQLDLADGDEIAVMAIQRADGRAATAAAQRLAALVDAYGTAPERGAPPEHPAPDGPAPDQPAAGPSTADADPDQPEPHEEDRP